MANFHRLLTVIFFCLAFCSPAFSQSAPVGAIDLAGWIKNANGTYSKAFGNSTVTRNAPTNSTLSATSNALVQTSKGATPFEITKTATIDTARIGSAVAKFARRVGPVGMAIGTASLICELTDICDVDGVFNFYTNLTGIDAIETHVGWCVNNGGQSPCFPDKDLRAAVQAANACFSANPSNCEFGDATPLFSGATLIGASYRLKFKSDGSYSQQFPANFMGTYVPPAPTSAPATEANWDSKAALLNDDRFTPSLVDAGEDVPTGIPTLTPDQKKGLGLESKPTRDSSGNVTGREDTTTEIEAVDAGTTDNPGRVIIKETQTTIKYDINNNQINTTTNTSYSSQPQPDKPQQNFEIKFDEVPPAELQTHNVQATLTSNSWGEGTCPPDIPIDISYYPMNLVIPTAPVCDTAEKINPFVLLIASIAGIYIVSGVRGGEYK